MRYYRHLSTFVIKWAKRSRVRDRFVQDLAQCYDQVNEEKTYAYSDNGHSENPDLEGDEGYIFSLGLLQALMTLHKKRYSMAKPSYT